MRRIYGGHVGQIVPAQNGIVFAIGDKTDDGQIAVSYKFYSFETSRVSKVEKSAYLQAKFGDSYNRFMSNLDDYINCHIANIPGDKMLVVHSDGNALIIDEMGKVLWRGDLRYNEANPLDVVSDGAFVWISYPMYDCVIKYNAGNMHQVFRAGSPEDKAFSVPCGLAVYDSKLMICCTDSNEIKSFDTENYSLKTYAKLSEPVYRYYRIGFNEIVLTESGVYIF